MPEIDGCQEIEEEDRLLWANMLKQALVKLLGPHANEER